MSRAPNLRFPVPASFTDDPHLWFFQLEAMFIVNRVTTEKDKYAVVVANLPYSVVRRIPRNLVTRDHPVHYPQGAGGEGDGPLRLPEE